MVINLLDSVFVGANQTRCGVCVCARAQKDCFREFRQVHPQTCLSVGTQHILWIEKLGECNIVQSFLVSSLRQDGCSGSDHSEFQVSTTGHELSQQWSHILLQVGPYQVTLFYLGFVSRQLPHLLDCTKNKYENWTNNESDSVFQQEDLQPTEAWSIFLLHGLNWEVSLLQIHKC